MGQNLPHERLIVLLRSYYCMYGSYYETDDSNSTPSNITDMRFLDVGVSLLDQEKHKKHSISVQEESWQIYSAIQIFEIRSIHGSSATTSATHHYRSCFGLGWSTGHFMGQLTFIL